MKALTITESADTGLYQLIPPLPQLFRLFAPLPWSARSMHCNSCNVALQCDREPTKTMPWNWRMGGRVPKQSVFGCFWSTLRVKVRIVFGSFLGSVFFFCFLSWYHLPCICNSLELESVTLHGICYILAWSLRILHEICYMSMFAFHFAWYLPRFGTSTSHLHGIYYILVLQPFMWVSWGFL